MKNDLRPLYILISCFLFLSCGPGAEEANSNNNDSTVTKAAINPLQFSECIDSALLTGILTLDTIPPTDKRAKFFVDLYHHQVVCAASQTDSCATNQYGTASDCSSNYCVSNDCTRKIVCCHRISESIFDQLTMQKTLGHAEFSDVQFHNIVDQASCTTQYIRMSSNGVYCYIARVNDTTSSSSAARSHYSVALLQGIGNGVKKVSSIIVYIGTPVVYGGVVRKLVPFQINYNDNTVEYFDVSNDHP